MIPADVPRQRERYLEAYGMHVSGFPESPDFDVIALLTTVTRDYDRISMHGVRRSLLRKQADSLGLSLGTGYGTDPRCAVE